jgi:hypothetical protein
MPGWLFCLIFGPVAVAFWLLVVRGILRGELGLRGSGPVRRPENPLGFWLYATLLIVMGLGFTAVLVWIGVQAGQGKM